jgi:hypothetical protein
VWDSALVALLRRVRGRAKTAIGITGHIHTSAADTIARIEDFRRPGS